MLNFLGVESNFSVISGMQWTSSFLFRDDLTGAPTNLDGVTFTGSAWARPSAGGAEQEYKMKFTRATADDMRNVIEVDVPALPEGRWRYAIMATDDSGASTRLLNGFITALGQLPRLNNDSYAKRTLILRMPRDNGEKLQVEWAATTVAEFYAGQAEKSADKAEAQAKIAKQEADRATQQADNAAASAAAAKQSETNAKNSAAAAKQSELNAKNSADTASKAAEAAGKSEEAAAESARNAATSANSAADSARAAESSAKTAQKEAADAKTYANNAEASAQRAAGSANAAGKSEENAAASAKAAATSESNAKKSQEAAAASATDASNKASEAGTYAKNAQTSATQAATSASNASRSSSAAATSAANAKKSETNAKNSETAAGKSETNAAASAAEAKEAADSVHDFEGSIDEVKKNAALAQQSAQNAAFSESNAEKYADIAERAANEAQGTTGVDVSWCADKEDLEAHINDNQRHIIGGKYLITGEKGFQLGDAESTSGTYNIGWFELDAKRITPGYLKEILFYNTSVIGSGDDPDVYIQVWEKNESDSNFKLIGVGTPGQTPEIPIVPLNKFNNVYLSGRTLRIAFSTDNKGIWSDKDFFYDWRTEAHNSPEDEETFCHVLTDRQEGTYEDLYIVPHITFTLYTTSEILTQETNGLSEGNNFEDPIIGAGATGAAGQSVALGRNSAALREGVAIGQNAKMTAPAGTAIGKDTVTAGNGAIALGWHASSSGNSATAIGVGTTTNGQSATAIAPQAAATGDFTIAIGEYAAANLEKAIAIGQKTKAGQNAVAIGTEANANGEDTVVIGALSSAQAGGSIAVGCDAVCEDHYSIAIGEGSESTNTSSIALGYTAVSHGLSSIAIGDGAEVKHDVTETNYSIAIGPGAKNSYMDTAVISVGDPNSETSNLSVYFFAFNSFLATKTGTKAGMGYKTASGEEKYISFEKLFAGGDALPEGNSFKWPIIGTGATASTGGEGSSCVGYLASANSYSSAVFGARAKTLGGDCVAIGVSAFGLANNTTSVGYGSIAGGDSAQATSKQTGTGAVAVGYSSVASAVNSIAIGPSATVYGENSIIIGANTETSYSNSVQIGANTSTESKAVAIGEQAQAGTDAIAIGYVADIRANKSIGIGDHCHTLAAQTIVIGANSEENGDWSILLGTNVLQSYSNCFTVRVGEGAHSVTWGICGQDSARINKAGTSPYMYYYVGEDDPAQNEIPVRAISLNDLFNLVESGGSSSGGGSELPEGNNFEQPVIGTGATGKGTYAVALGNKAKGEGNYSVAVGYLSHTAENSVAIGGSATALTNQATSVGCSSSATTLGTSLGYGAQSSNMGLAVGINAKASVIEAVAIGAAASAHGANSIVVGSNSSINGSGDFAHNILNSIILGANTSLPYKDTCLIKVGSEETQLRLYIFGAESPLSFATGNEAGVAFFNGTSTSGKCAKLSTLLSTTISLGSITES